MRHRICLLGEFSLHTAPAYQAVPMRSYRRLVALLTLHLESGISRRRLSDLAFPGESHTVANNRLRVALSTLRKLMPGALESDSERVGLRPEAVEVDLHLYGALLAEVQDELSETTELRSLGKLIEPLGSQIDPTFYEEWADAARKSWSSVALPAIRRGVQLASSKGDHAAASKFVRASLVHDPFDSTVWRLFFQGCRLADHRAQALELFAKVRAMERSDPDEGFSREIREMAATLRSGAITGEMSISAREAELYARLVSTIIEHRPDIARNLFGARDGYFVEVNAVDAAIPILERLVESAPDRSLGWQSCMWNLMSIHVNLGKLEVVPEMGPQILAVAEDPHIRGSVLTYLSIYHRSIREFERARQDIDAAIDILERAGLKGEAMVCRFHRGNWLVDLEEFERAIETFEEVIAYFEPLEGAIRDLRISESSVKIAGLHFVAGRDALAYSFVKRSYDLARERAYEAAYPIILPTLAYLELTVNENPEGFDLMIQGIKGTFRRSNDSMKAFALELCAGMLRTAAKGRIASELLEFTDRWRERTGNHRPNSHSAVIDHWREALPEVPRQDLHSEDPVYWAKRAIVALRAERSKEAPRSPR